MTKALITGITGQDGSYLTELLLDKGYKVYGLVRRVANQSQENRLSRIQHLLDNENLKLIDGDIRDYGTLINIFRDTQIDEIYHLAAQSDVAHSFRDPRTTLETNIMGTHNVLDCVRRHGCKMYFAASSEMYGKVRETPQNEQTPFYPRSPYGVSKVAGFELVRNYREAYGAFACSGILFNHESPRRGEEFVTRKIAKGVAAIAKGTEQKIQLGNRSARRDWGHAKDYVHGMWLMLQHDKPDDYVLATGETHSVNEFLKLAFAAIGIDDFSDYVTQNSSLMRPSDVELLLGDATKAKMILKWAPEYKFNDLVEEMIDTELSMTGQAKQNRMPTIEEIYPAIFL